MMKRAVVMLIICLVASQGCVPSAAFPYQGGATVGFVEYHLVRGEWVRLFEPGIRLAHQGYTIIQWVKFWAKWSPRRWAQHSVNTAVWNADVQGWVYYTIDAWETYYQGLSQQAWADWMARYVYSRGTS